MKRLNPQTNRPYRCGDIDLDTGMIFRCYNMQRVRKDGTFTEIWLQPDSFAAIKERMRLRAKHRRDAGAFTRTQTTKQIIAALG